MPEDRLPSTRKIREVLIDVLRCSAGESFFVRLLSDGYGGLFTHYVKKRSEYCPGERCNCQHRKQQRIWKGYAAVEVWTPDQKAWRAAVLEITENLEHCFNGRYRRGDVWAISRRRPDTEQDSYPVQAEFSEKLNPDLVPRSFDWRPVMMRKFHVLEPLETHHPNPLPPPSFAAFSLDSPPKALQSKPEDTPADADHVRKLLDQRRQREAALLAADIGAMPPADQHKQNGVGT